MIAPQEKLMDWSAIQANWLFMPRADEQNSRLEEAIRLLKSSDFIPTESPPARVEFNNLQDFGFSTPRPCKFVENNFAVGRFYRTIEHWQQHPAIILLHGGNAMGGGKASLGGIVLLGFLSEILQTEILAAGVSREFGSDFSFQDFFASRHRDFGVNSDAS